jgi:hypothetical protein
MILILRAFLCLSLAGLSYLSFAQDYLKITPLTCEIDFDGMPVDQVWQSLQKLELTQHFPVFGSNPSEKNDVRIGYDRHYLWIGAILYYSDISKLVSTSKKRDEVSDNSDSFGIILDTFSDNENALAFFTMPSGLKIDFTVSNDASGGGQGSTNYTWNSYWDVKTARDDRAWYVEMRIPFSSLRFQSKGSITHMGIIVNRRISHSNEIDTYPLIDTKYGDNARLKPSLASKIYFENIEPHNPVYISPYLLAGFTLNNDLNAEGTAFAKDENWEYNGGVDVKYNLNNNLTMDLTANTDFAQVEADDQQVNLTRYSLFFPEKRLFFQERSGIFSFNLGGQQELFYSRNIGIYQGEPVRILGGARLVGRVGKWDVGVLNMNTARHNGNPAENFGVARLRKQVFNQNSYIGAIFSSRAGFDGNHNVSYGIDGIVRLFGDDYLDIKFAQSTQSGQNMQVASLNPSFLSLAWERRSDKGFGYEIKYAWFGKDFNPGTGFMFNREIQQFKSDLQYGIFPGESSPVFWRRFSLDFAYVSRLEDGALENMEIAPQFIMQWKSGFNLFASLNFLKEGVANDFPLSENVVVPAGDYFFVNFFGDFSTPSNKKISATLGYEIGEFFDGNQLSAELETDFNVSSSLQISGSYKYDKVKFESRNQIFTNNLARLKLTYMLNTHLSVSSYVQLNESDSRIITNLRLRYNPSDGNDFYLVFNDLRDTRDSTGGIRIPSYLTRTVMVKYTHTLRL